MTTKIEDLLTLEKLREWAESKQPDGVVGIPSCTDCCPVATYLAEQGYKYVFVGSFRVEHSRPAISIPIPKPIRLVTYTVDELPMSHDILAADFLSILDIVEALYVLEQDTEASNH